jgi:hypothetical protein
MKAGQLGACAHPAWRQLGTQGSLLPAWSQARGWQRQLAPGPVSLVLDGGRRQFTSQDEGKRGGQKFSKPRLQPRHFFLKGLKDFLSPCGSPRQVLVWHGDFGGGYRKQTK